MKRVTLNTGLLGADVRPGSLMTEFEAQYRGTAAKTHQPGLILLEVSRYGP